MTTHRKVLIGSALAAGVAILQQVFGVPLPWTSHELGAEGLVIEMPSRVEEMNHSTVINGKERQVVGGCAVDRVAVPTQPLVGLVVYCTAVFELSDIPDEKDWFDAVIAAEVQDEHWTILSHQERLTGLPWPALELTLSTRHESRYWIRILRVGSHAVLLTRGSFGPRRTDDPNPRFVESLRTRG